MWFRWVIDFGRPGPDRGEGGKYLLVGPGYDGYLPEGQFNVAHSRTNRVIVLGRSFLTDNDPAPTVAEIKSTTKTGAFVVCLLLHAPLILVQHHLPTPLRCRDLFSGC